MYTQILRFVKIRISNIQKEKKMASGTKDALADALRKMMTVKPIDKVTVKDIAF